MTQISDEQWQEIQAAMPDESGIYWVKWSGGVGWGVVELEVYDDWKDVLIPGQDAGYVTREDCAGITWGARLFQPEQQDARERALVEWVQAEAADRAVIAADEHGDADAWERITYEEAVAALEVENGDTASD